MRVGRGWIAAALALCGTASAQTSVTLYGIADANVRLDHTTVGTLKSIGSGGEDASRFGLRGVEPLGGGLDAIFDFEQDVDLGDNSVPQGDVSRSTPSAPLSSSGGRFFGRRAIVGLRSDAFGELRVGRERTSFYDAWTSVDPWAAGTVSSLRNVAIGNIARFDNAITYESAPVSGFRLAAQFAPGEATTDAFGRRAGDGASASLTYAAGPVLATAAWLVTRPGPRRIHAGTVGATADLDVVKLHALGFFSDDVLVGRTFSYGLGTTIPLGAFRLIGIVARIDNRTKGPRFDDEANARSLNDANFFSIGATYAFSKRTSLYLAAARLSNHGGATFDLSDNSNEGLYTASNVAPGFHPWSTQFGVRHRF